MGLLACFDVDIDNDIDGVGNGFGRDSNVMRSKTITNT
jgi:hypothetical protein